MSREQAPSSAPMLSSSDYEVFLIDAKWIVSRLWKARLVLILALVAGLTVGIAAFVLWPKSYRAEAVLVRASDSQEGRLAGLAGQFSGLATLAGINGGQGDSTEEAIALLKSRGFLEDFISSNDLLPILFDEEWDSGSNAWVDKDSLKHPTLWRGYALLSDRMRVSRDPVTGVVTLSIDWKDPVQAAQWVNILVDRMNSRMRERVISEARRSLEFLQKSFEETSIVALREAISRLMESQMQEMMLASVRQDFSFRVVDEARPPSVDDYTWPNAAIFAGIGLLLGGVVGIAYAAFRVD